MATFLLPNGVFATELAHLFGGAMLLLSFMLLYQRRLPALVNVLAVQGAVLALAAFWQGFVQDAPQLFVVGLIALLAKAVGLPWALHALGRRLGLYLKVDAALGIGLGMVAGVALVGLAVLVVQPMVPRTGAIAREDLALALSVLLLGLLMVASRRNILSQVVGLLSLENGLMLAAIGIPGLPMVAALAVAALLLVAAIIGGIYVLDLRGGLDDLDLAGLQARADTSLAGQAATPENAVPMPQPASSVEAPLPAAEPGVSDWEEPQSLEELDDWEEAAKDRFPSDQPLWDRAPKDQTPKDQTPPWEEEPPGR